MFRFLRRKPPRPREGPENPGRARQRPTDLFRFSGATMGTRYSVSCAISRDQDKDLLAAEVDRAVNLVDCQMSTWKPESPLSRFNASPCGDWFAVPAPLAHVVATGLALSRDTRGAFDMTVGAAVNLWGFGPAGTRQRAPDSAAAEAAGSSCGYTALEARRDPPALRKTADCYVDLSGIAKGYGVDQIARALEEHGVVDYLVTIDGEVRLRGRKPGTDPHWILALDAPIAGEQQMWDVLEPPDGALATSGDYRHFFQDGGQKFAHTIDPRSGRPVANSIASVTVFHRDCMLADAWATALLVLGAHDGVALAQAREISALFLIRTPEGIDDVMTCGFSDLLASDGLMPQMR